MAAVPPPVREIPSNLADRARIAGAYDYLDPACGLRGWLVHPGTPGQPLRLEARSAGQVLATSVAVLNRPDIDKALGRKTWCGFLLGWSRFDRAQLDRLADAAPDQPVQLLTGAGALKLRDVAGPLTVGQLRDLVAAAPTGDQRPAFADLNAWLRIEASGLFDPRFHAKTYGADPERPALLQYIQDGERKGQRPNLYFDPAAHAARFALGPDAPRLLHALDHGLADGPHFDSAFYRRAHGLADDAPALAHYLAHRPSALPRAEVTEAMLSDHPRDRYEGFLRRLVNAPARHAGFVATPVGAAILADGQRLFGRPAAVKAPGPPRRQTPADEDLAALVAGLQAQDPARLDAGSLCAAAYRLVRPGLAPDPALAPAETLVLQGLARFSATNPHAFRARMHMLLHRQRLAELDSLLAEAEAQPVAAQLDLGFRRLEMLFATGRPDAALTLWRDTLDRKIPEGRAEAIVLLRLLSGAEDWPAAGRVVLDHLSRGHGFGETRFHALRAVRKAGLHAQILALTPGPGADPDLQPFRELVAQDHQLIQAALGRAAPRPPAGWLAATETSAATPPQVLFLCTDRRYFLSALTCLASILGQPAQTPAEIFVFLDKDVPEDWAEALPEIAKPWGRRLSLVAESEFVPQGVAHKTELGFFGTSGGLSRAAYFRLYAARHLGRLGRFARGLYLDTDIICRGDLAPLFALDLDGAPLAARPEDDGPEVRAAAERNGIDPARYFNSGVMLMDFAHPDLTAGLEAAITLSETAPERLVFHDQCALNIAFHPRAAALPATWNFFLRPFRADNGAVQDRVLLHYLDKPKPWDLSFWRDYREEWRVWALILGQSLPPDLFTALLAAANES